MILFVPLRDFVFSGPGADVAKRNRQILRTPCKRNKTSANVTMAPVSPVKYT